MSKSKYQKRHAKFRAHQRYGITLNQHKAVSDIQEGRAVFIERQSNRVTIWKINQENTELVVVYDKIRKVIVSALPYQGFLKGLLS